MPEPGLALGPSLASKEELGGGLLSTYYPRRWCKPVQPRLSLLPLWWVPLGERR